MDPQFNGKEYGEWVYEGVVCADIWKWNFDFQVYNFDMVCQMVSKLRLLIFFDIMINWKLTCLVVIWIVENTAKSTSFLSCPQVFDACGGIRISSANQ